MFEAFKRWKTKVEDVTGLKIKKLRVDNGGEYKDIKFKFYYKYEIRMERIVSDMPQHNGVVERMNQRLTERARSIHIQLGPSKHFWAEAVNTTAYLINRGSSVPLEHQIPEELQNGKELKLSQKFSVV